jgi:MFS family permease
MASLARRSLWRHRDFVRLWSGATVSVLGSQITLIALPYIAVTMLGASVLQVSALAAVEMLPFLLFTLPAGAWLDRVRRRPVLVAADIGRGVVLLTIPVAYGLDALTLGQLFVVAFVTGTLTTLSDVAGQSFLPAIVDRDDLVDGNAHLQIGNSVAQIGGPAIGGNLIAIAAAPFAIAFDAVSFFISGGFICAIHRREVKPERRLDADGRPIPMRTEIAQGLRYVLGNRYLRPIAACTGMSNLFGAALFGIFPFLIWHELQLPPAFFGTVMGLGSIGFLVGAALSNRLPRAIGLGPTIVISAALGCPAFLLLTLTPAALAGAAVTLFVGWFAAGFAQVVYNVAQISLRQAITPPDMQSRMNATMRFIVWGTIPIGSLMGGAIASVMPVRTALIIAAAATFTSIVPVALSPLRRLHGLPEEAGATLGATAQSATGRLRVASAPTREEPPEPPSPFEPRSLQRRRQ